MLTLLGGRGGTRVKSMANTEAVTVYIVFCCCLVLKLHPTLCDPMEPCELPCPPPGDLPDPGIEPLFLMSPALAGRFFTTSATWEAQRGSKNQGESSGITDMFHVHSPVR